jgi:hypothetical protein
MLIRTSQREEHETTWTPIHELASQLWRNSDQLTDVEFGLLSLDHEGQYALEDEVHLLLPYVAMNPATLTRAEDDLVQPKSGHAELAPKRDEAVRRVLLKSCSRGAVLHLRIFARDALR